MSVQAPVYQDYDNGYKQLRIKAFIILLFILYPLGALPFILVEIYHRKRYAFTLFALWLGLFAMLYAPVSDYYRHLCAYFTYKYQPLDKVLQDFHMDLGLTYISFFAAKAGIHFEIVRFLFTFVSLQSTFYIFNDICDRNPVFNDRKYFFLFFLILCLSFNYFGLILGLRWITAQSLFLLSAYLLLVKKNRLGYIYGALSVFIHLGIAGYVIGLVLFCIIKVKVPKPFALIFFVIACILSTAAFDQLLLLFGKEEMMAGHLDAYINGSWGKDVFTYNLNENARIHSYIQRLPLLPLVLYVLFESWNNKSELTNIIVYAFFLLGLTMNFTTVQGRFIGVFIMLGLFFFMQTFQKTRIKIYCMRFTLIVCLISFASNAYVQRRFFPAGREYMWIYSPSFVILNNSYDEPWTFEHIDAQGFPRR